MRRATTAAPIVAEHINFKAAPRFAAAKYISDPLVREVFADPH